ncbi:hypothetical protein EIP91_001762 [Steccherinum ochraceum]|uniref:F-box domain-containing protein n=1 Tax=Steccherinum ochraceum TaxID=92696 RepID=A0A4R0RDB1_9APHY|nr:hypothetical protein EIP91_001762 [Steccherinum ochraceum]
MSQDLQPDLIKCRRSGRDLAVELLEIILDFIPTQDVNTLSSLALTCHLFCQLARPRMFHHVTVANAHESRNFNAFRHLIDTSSGVGEYIRTLQLKWFAPSRPLSTSRATRSLEISVLARMLQRLPALRRLTISDINLVSSIHDTILSDFSPIALDYLELGCLGTIPGKASDMFDVLSLFGTVGHLVVKELPDIACSCAVRADSAPSGTVRRRSRSSAEYFQRMFEFHHPKLSLAVGSLDMQGMRYWPLPFLFMLKTLQVTPSVQSLTCLSISFRGMREVVACGELLRLCGPNLLHCNIELMYDTIDADSPLQSDALCLSHCTALTSLSITTEQRFNLRVDFDLYPMFLGTLSHAHIFRLEHITIPLRSWDGHGPGLDARSQWEKLRGILDRCKSLESFSLAGLSVKDSAVRGVVEAELKDCVARGILD